MAVISSRVNVASGLSVPSGQQGCPDLSQAAFGSECFLSVTYVRAGCCSACHLTIAAGRPCTEASEGQSYHASRSSAVGAVGVCG